MTREELNCTLDIISHSSAQTQRLGMRLGNLLQGGELVLLDGQLGTGKTTFTQGLAQGMDITETINSPTFTLLKEYAGRSRPPAEIPTDGERRAKRRQSVSQRLQQGPALYHFDLYRLDDPEEILDLGFEDYFNSDNGVCVVEWADKAAALWPDERLHIRMRALSETKRNLLFVATGTRYCELLRQFQKNTYATARS
ncbi:MAG TPA: tRNA (adenosine(37)-N6)-threonylcarbamoyltransferase complex ATPase subunit type 1 TsaE [Ktedonobacteraceae bacterium]|nr:tRNA (adenosine(37)-N6)-threonylcarbamoyltransferase complex ATPase subunit type 1 TsaE [Ktedonobacteraceae bacterium]